MSTVFGKTFEYKMLDDFESFVKKHESDNLKELINKFVKRYREYEGRQLFLHKYYSRYGVKYGDTNSNH